LEEELARVKADAQEQKQELARANAKIQEMMMKLNALT
jgi:hypothetical protein